MESKDYLRPSSRTERGLIEIKKVNDSIIEVTKDKVTIACLVKARDTKVKVIYWQESETRYLSSFMDLTYYDLTNTAIKKLVRKLCNTKKCTDC